MNVKIFELTTFWGVKIKKRNVVRELFILCLLFFMRSFNHSSHTSSWTVVCLFICENEQKGNTAVFRGIPVTKLHELLAVHTSRLGVNFRYPIWP